jgi:hypothetical protein
MREDIDPVRWAGQQAVVALPGQRDTPNAGQIREELLSVINGSATALIADMTATTSCGHAGADAVVARPGASWQQILVGSIVRYGR